MKAKGKAPNAMMDLMASMLSERIMTRPSVPKITPQPSLIPALGLRSLLVENMPSTNAALTTLVTRNRKAATTTAAIVRLGPGKFARTKKVTSLTLLRTTCRIGISALSALWKPTLPKTTNQRPAESSALSFAVGGTVATVEVNQGDRVTAGQMLAILDTKPFDLDIDAARSGLEAAEATYAEAELELERKTELFKKDWVAKATLDTATAAAESARGSVEAARSQLGLAERNFGKSQLVAPFNGVIAERDVDPFTEVAAGSPAFGINSDDGLEIHFSVPDAVVARITGGLPVEVTVATVAGCGCEGRITEIGSTAGTANAVNLVAALTSEPDALLPGMSAEIEMSLAGR